jgi:hypothetical protein
MTLKHEKPKQALHLFLYVLLWLHPTSIKLNESMSHVVLIFSVKFIKI